MDLQKAKDAYANLARCDELQRESETLLRRVLEKHGWTYTSSTPDFCWSWVKTLPDGRTALVNESTARSYLEREIGSAHPELCPHCQVVGVCECMG